jgi:pyruvate/2-oxoglutarate/acetoin dehydrogenase E1 component
MKEMTYIGAIREALIEEMDKDEKVFMLGENIRGCAFEHTQGLVDKYGLDRILDTPLSETAIAGAGIGSAIMGYRPVVDFMFADFMYVASDEILLKAAQWRFMQGGKVQVPVVFLAAAGGYQMNANEHSRIQTALFLHHPGLKVVVPATPYDAKGLLKTAIQDNNPVVFLWHKMLMMDTGEVPEEEYSIPLGEADIKREGTDITVVANSYMTQLALQAAEELEGQVGVEVVDLRSLEPLDLGTVLKSLEKTERLVVVDEDTERCGFAGELCAQVIDQGFDLLDAPIKRVCARNYPIPGGYMEAHVLPNTEKIKVAIEEVMA